MQSRYLVSACSLRSPNYLVIEIFTRPWPGGVDGVKIDVRRAGRQVVLVVGLSLRGFTGDGGLSR